MVRRILSHSDITLFLEDPDAFLLKITGKPRPPETLYQIVGNVVHRLASGTDKCAGDEFIRRRLEQLSEADKEKAFNLIRKHMDAIAYLDESYTEGSPDREKKLAWTDPVTLWSLVAKPDELIIAHGNDYMQIADFKTAFRLSPKHKEQLYFFAMVASLATGYKGPVRLVVKLLGSRCKEVFWYSPKATARSLSIVRSVIARIEVFLVSNGLCIENRNDMAA
ncbi:MAG: PD-(D/E)XK nuclease family protein [Candidatus Obscuribacterales bacterium]|nr:PD-(D/E)XK nuclease family protein [Candidatus Obscuribacterales bacterium]